MPSQLKQLKHRREKYTLNNGFQILGNTLYRKKRTKERKQSKQDKLLLIAACILLQLAAGEFLDYCVGKEKSTSPVCLSWDWYENLGGQCGLNSQHIVIREEKATCRGNSWKTEIWDFREFPIHKTSVEYWLAQAHK